MAKQLIYIKCPVCGWNHVARRTGINRLIRGEPVDNQERDFSFRQEGLDEGGFISIREARGRQGFKEIGTFTLKEFIRGGYDPALISSLKEKCQAILRAIQEAE